MSHILVTGANGLIGSHLVRKLLELKKKENWEEEIVCLVRNTSDLSSLKGLDVKLVIGDIRYAETLEPAVRGASYIYHLAAELFPIDRKGFQDSIVLGTRNMLEAAVKYCGENLKRFLHVSSQAAAGPSKDTTPLTEADTPGPPVSWYAGAKLEAENIVKEFTDKIPITVVRPCSVYGERDQAMKQIFLAVNMRVHPLTGFKRRYTGMVYAKDLAEGFIAAAHSDKAVGETYFLCNPVNYSVKEVSEAIGRGIGKKRGLAIPVPLFLFRLGALVMELLHLFTRQKPIPTLDKVRDMSQVYWLCTPAKAKKDFGWEAKHTLEEGGKATVDFYLEEARTIKKMPLETKGLLWLKYFFFSVLVGIIIEYLASFGNVYKFTPGWFVIVAIFGLWGVLFGSFAMWTRTCNVIIQYIPGFLLLLGFELLNHYYLHLWKFTNDSLFGITDPIMRAVVLGIVSGFLIPIINAFMRGFYQRRLRLG
jgi:nucleoside-diphosphate-sugar epimerase